ncbi:N-acetylmuramoyl-L-alanine amidase [Dendrosporobacter sp. 1207_IL3150]|uniref:N-acetylmuramoyl-L-alanine amidase n=1 Tax=Dendrosporobacter sp. 1207_IL3150 TaxID=3084054 RepID=UPI002FDA079F
MRKINLDELRIMAENAKAGLKTVAENLGRPVKIYIHWSAGHYDQYYNDYHINIGKNGELFVSTDDFNEYKLHTYHRNSGAVAISAACAYNAHSANDLGPEPPTDYQIEGIAQSLAVLTKALDIPIDNKHVMTHAEAADNLDGDFRWHEPYGPASTVERWDFWVIKEGDEPGSGGDILRGKGVWYCNNGL